MDLRKCLFDEHNYAGVSVNGNFGISKKINIRLRVYYSLLSKYRLSKKQKKN